MIINAWRRFLTPFTVEVVSKTEYILRMKPRWHPSIWRFAWCEIVKAARDVYERGAPPGPLFIAAVVAWMRIVVLGRGLR
jgi:hypothetical protein